MIEYVFLSLGVAGTATCAYHVAPAARGVHRYVVPRSKLRADNARLEDENEQMVCVVARALRDVQAARRDRDEAWSHLRKAELLVADLDGQLAELGDLRAENTRLTAELANATAMRERLPGPSPADTASALSDGAQEFVNATATAWRASA